MKGEWIKTVPTEPGRYFYRDLVHHDYGIALVAWRHGYCHSGIVSQPKLGLQCTSIWGQQHPEGWMNSYGENTDHPGWSSSCGVPPSDNLEFWSEPIETPPGIPALGGRPPDIPQEEIDAEMAKSEKKHKEAEAKEREQEKARKAAIKLAKAQGRALYECDDCGELWREEDLVLGKERECPNCGETFVSEERNCPSCNRPFTRVNEERMSCPDCVSGGELPELTTLVEGKKR